MDRRSFLKYSIAGGFAFPAFASASRPVLDSVNERKLSFLNLHTGEKLSTTYWADGQYVEESLLDIHKILRDFRTGEVHLIDRRLLDLLCTLQLTMGSSGPFEVISGYRSPKTNAALHAESSGVATNSLHMTGMAADIRIRDRQLRQLRESEMKRSVSLSR